MQIFAQITKVDAATGKVWGRAAAEVVDNAGEIFDYETSKPHFVAWSESVAKASGGKSVGNVRAMHNLVAAGKLTEMNFVDDERAIDVCAEIVDPVELDKCQKGVYTGFSIGGKYADKWDDKLLKGHKRYTALPNEISLVDVPCNRSCNFTVVKADGSNELRKFEVNGNDENMKLWQRAEQLTKIADAGRVGNSINALLDKPLVKGLWTVSNFAQLLDSLSWLQRDSEWEAEDEQDDSPVPAKIKAALQPLAAAFLAMAAEEVSEAIGTQSTTSEAMAMSDKTGDLAKAEARVAALEAAVAQLTEQQQKMNKAVGGDEEELRKAANDLQKAQGRINDLEGDLQKRDVMLKERDELLIKAAGRIDELSGILTKMYAEPVPVQISMRAVSKAADSITAAEGDDSSKVFKADGTVDESLTELRKALRNPVRTA